MPIVRVERGRGYTKRAYLRVEGELTADDVRRLDRATADMRLAIPLEGKLTKSEHAARTQLTCSGLPLDPYDPLYSDDWMRRNERRSLDWYAVRLLRVILLWRDHLEKGDVENAMAECFVLGELVNEAKMVVHMVGGQSRGGEGAKGTDERLKQQKERERLQAEAEKIWKRHPDWSKTAVAARVSKLDGVSASIRTIRREIRKPK
jgi:hypothetical protein